MFQARFGKVYDFGWWDMYRIQTGTGSQFSSKKFQEGIYVRGLQLLLAASEHQEINGQAEVTWKSCELSHIQLWRTQMFLTNIYIVH